jgi:hypothetical protein
MRLAKFYQTIWGRCYDHNFLRFLPIFSKTNAMIKFLHNLHGFVLSQKRQFFGENIFKIITSDPGHTARAQCFLRIQTLGKTLLCDKFDWTPHQLQAMIHKIDKICPEEGLPANPLNLAINRGPSMSPNPTNVE